MVDISVPTVALRIVSVLKMVAISVLTVADGVVSLSVHYQARVDWD